jgi:hypothetical protein
LWPSTSYSEDSALLMHYTHYIKYLHLYCSWRSKEIGVHSMYIRWFMIVIYCV